MSPRALVLLLLAACAPARREAVENPAFEAFRAGDFDRAEALLRGATDEDSRVLAGRLHLLRNRGKEAAEAFFPLVSEYPPFGSRKPTRNEELQRIGTYYPEIAMAFLRADDFTNAARVYQAMGDRVLERKYEALGRSVGYLSNLGEAEVAVDLLGIDPIPHLTMTVNGRSGVFLIDTSLDEIVLDREFARRAGLTGHGVRTTAFQVTYDESTAEEVGLGRLKVKNVPVHLGRLTPVAKVRADGALGLSFLMHFDFTLDYRKQRLVLRRPGSALPGGRPAVLAGDRYLLVQGSVNGKPGVWLSLHTAMPDVVAAASEGAAAAWGEVRELSAGGLRLAQPPLDPTSFPLGLDGGFGFPTPFLLAHIALRDHVLRLEPRSMRLLLD